MGPSGGATDALNHSCDPNCVARTAGHDDLLIHREGMTFDSGSFDAKTLDERWERNQKASAHRLALKERAIKSKDSGN